MACQYLNAPATFVEGMVFVKLPPERKQHGLGVKGGAVVEADPSAQVEGPRELIVRDVPRMRELRHHGRALAVVGHQRFVDVVADLERFAVVFNPRI